MKKTILVADDDHAIAEVIEIVLTDAGYDVVTEEKGDQVFSVAKEIRPDLILLDNWLTGASGTSVIKALKQHEQTQSIPVILVSANNDTAKLAKEAGADSFLPKPFDVDELITIVQKFS